MWRIAYSVILITCSSVAFAAPSRTITANVPARALSALRLTAEIGSVSVTTSRDNAVHVKVAITPKQHGFLGIFHWSKTNTKTQLSGIKLNQSREKGALVLSLTYPSGLDDSDVKAKWLIGMPARQHFTAKVDVGKLDLNGIAGGVDLKVNVGKINIKIPRGAIHAKVNVGKIDAMTATHDRGEISLDSNVGATELHMPNAPKNESRQRSGTSSSVHVPGKGKDDMKLEVNVGKADLTIRKP